MSIQNLRRKLINRKNALADCSGHLVLLHSLFGQPKKNERKSPDKSKKLTVYSGCMCVCVCGFVCVCVCVYKYAFTNAYLFFNGIHCVYDKSVNVQCSHI